jgi:hypothetical protein
VTVASLYLVTTGALMAIAGGACMFRTTEFLGSDVLVGTMAQFLGLVTAAVLLLGIISVISGGAILGGATWARWLGVMVCVIAIVALAGWMVLVFAAGARLSNGIVEAVVILLYGLTIATLMRAGSWFVVKG